MKHIIAIVSLAIVGWAPPAYAQEPEPNIIPEAEYDIAQEMQQTGPAETVGVESSTILGAVPLGQDFEALRGRKLRAREVVLLPGARIAVHMHNQRPGVAYLLEGELVEHRSDSDIPLTRHVGAASFESTGIVHWWENLSGNKARVLVVDIVPEEME